MASTFSVARDPGRLLKYAGSLMICLGIAMMFYMRAYFFKARSRSWEPWLEKLHTISPGQEQNQHPASDSGVSEGQPGAVQPGATLSPHPPQVVAANVGGSENS
jgi:hypothetical protein